ncbi:MAG: SDR family NAD(P)-dependent oxidoreductase [Bacteroidetes bacterium]|nr:SDR family NAD(P)-dependent oxidoreductase [Bacteroidota bacterium]
MGRDASFIPDDATDMLSTAPSASVRNRVVLITGGTSGIGRAMVDALASAGARIAIAARGLDAGERVVAEAIGGSERRIRPVFPHGHQRPGARGGAGLGRCRRLRPARRGGQQRRIDGGGRNTDANL